MAPLHREGFWGEATSTLDWCEENYVVTRYIAEFCEYISLATRRNLLRCVAQLIQESKQSKQQKRES